VTIKVLIGPIGADGTARAKEILINLNNKKGKTYNSFAVE
jgi:hypothetical protein